MIWLYQKITFFFPPSCRFYPTCSEYTYQAISQYGVVKGGFYSVKRLLSCHPFHPGGYDPLTIRDYLKER